MMNQLQLLLVDDDEMTLFIHNKIMKCCELPCDVHSFQSAEDCLNHMATMGEEVAFLILLDINMPGMSGWEMLDKLKETHSSYQVSVIMATSSVDFDDRKRAEGDDCVIDFFEKPFSLDICESLRELPICSAQINSH